MNEQTTPLEQSERERLLARIKALEERLEQQEQSSAALLDASPDLMALLDADGAIIHINRHMAKRLGVGIETARGANVFALLPPELTATRRTHAQEAMATGCPVHFVDSSGGQLFANRFHPVTTSAGESTALVVFATDITERRQQEERLRLLLEHVSDALVVVDANQRIRYISSGAERITGFAVADLEEKTIQTLIHPDDLNAVQSAWSEAIAHPDQTFTVRYRHVHKTRDWVYCEAVAQNGFDNPAIRGILATVRDITTQQMAEEQMHRQQQILNAIINATTESIHLIDREGTVLVANEATARRLGTTVEHLVGRCVFNFFPPEVARTRRNHLRSVFASGQPLFLKDQRQGLAFESHLWPLNNQNGHTEQVAIFSQDITARVQMERALRQSQTLLNATQRLAKVGGWQWQVADRTITWTEECFRLHGLTPDGQPTLSAELINRALACYREEDRPAILAAFHRCIDEGAPYDLQFPLRSHDGRDLWIRTMAAPVFEDGRIVQVRGNIMDITREKRLERLLAARLRLSEISSSLSLDELLASVLDEAEQLTGSVIGFFHFVNPDQQTLTLQVWSRSTTSHFCQAEGMGLHSPVAGAGVWMDCLHQRRAVIHNDYAALPHRKGLPAGHAPIIRELVAPVFRDAKIVAIFGVGNKGQEYDQDDIDMVTALGDLVWDIILRKRAEEEVRLSEERFRTLLAGLPSVAIQGYRPDGAVHYWNRASEQLYGYTAEEAIGRNLLDLIIPPEIRPEVEQTIASMAESGQPIAPEELSLMRSDGSRAPVFSSHVVLTVAGGPPELFCVDIDLTESKQAAEQLRQSEERFRLSFERSPVGAVMVSQDFRFLKANEAFSTMIGYSEEELLLFTFADITHPEERQRDLLQVQRMLAGDIYRYDVEKRYLHKNGAVVWARVNANLVRDAQHLPLFFLAIVQDITDQKMAEHALRESESRYQRIVDTAREGIWVMNDQQQTASVNEHTAAMLGLTPADMVGRPVEDFMFAEDLAGHEERMALRRQGQGGQYEHRFRNREGRAVWTIVSATPLKDEEGRFAGSFAMLTNITARKEAKEHLHAALAEKDVLLREVHHRVKNNLAAIISLLDMQRRLLKDTVGRDVLAKLATRIRSMSLIHEKLYRSSDLAHIQFQGYLQALLSHLRTSFGSPGIRCLADAEGVALPLDLAVPCGMIINELVTNALKYAFPPERLDQGRHACSIRVTMRRQDGGYTLVAADNGVGLPEGYDWMNAKTLGMTLVRMLGRHQLGGHLTLVHDQGLRITLTFTERRGKP